MSHDQKRLSIFGHIAELRTSLNRSVIVVAITTILSFVFAKQIFDILTFESSFIRPVFNLLASSMNLFTPPNISLIFIDITEMIGTYMKVCLVSGIILAMPYLSYEVIMFVSPALTSKEKRYVYLMLPWVTLMFAAGVIFGYFIMLPPMLQFLLTFGSDIATPQIRIGNYISIVTRILLISGLVFEMPVVITLLARLGVVKAKWLADKRKWAAILAFIAAGIITPTVDPINQAIVAAPIVILYEMSIWLARLVQRKRQA